jgi:tetratricopeptide (TPR) repeat protein
MTWHRTVFGLALVIAIGLQANAARAQSSDEARGHFNLGVKHYSMGRFDEAIVEFGKAYDIEGAPILLFNIAQSYRQLGKKDRALFFYRRYLEQKPDAANRAEVEKRVKDLQASIEADTKDQSKPPADADKPQKPTPAPVTPAQPAVPPRVDVTTRDDGQPSEDERARNRRLRIASIAVGGAGLALGITGFVFRGIATGKLDAIDADGKAMRPYNPANGDYQTYEGAGLGLMIGGAVALTAGVVGYFMFRDAAGGDPKVSLRVGPNDLGVAFSGRF